MLSALLVGFAQEEYRVGDFGKQFCPECQSRAIEFARVVERAERDGTMRAWRSGRGVAEMVVAEPGVGEANGFFGVISVGIARGIDV